MYQTRSTNPFDHFFHVWDLPSLVLNGFIQIAEIYDESPPAGRFTNQMNLRPSDGPRWLYNFPIYKVIVNSKFHWWNKHSFALDVETKYVRKLKEMKEGHSFVVEGQRNSNRKILVRLPGNIREYLIAIYTLIIMSRINRSFEGVVTSSFFHPVVFLYKCRAWDTIR